MFSERAISAVPIIDEQGVVVNLYETVDVIVGLCFHLLSSASLTLFIRLWLGSERTSHLT